MEIFGADRVHPAFATLVREEALVVIEDICDEYSTVRLDSFDLSFGVDSNGRGHAELNCLIDVEDSWWDGEDCVSYWIENSVDPGAPRVRARS